MDKTNEEESAEIDLLIESGRRQTAFNKSLAQIDADIREGRAQLIKRNRFDQYVCAALTGELANQTTENEWSKVENLAKHVVAVARTAMAVVDGTEDKPELVFSTSPIELNLSQEVRPDKSEPAPAEFRVGDRVNIISGVAEGADGKIIRIGNNLDKLPTEDSEIYPIKVEQTDGGIRYYNANQLQPLEHLPTHDVNVQLLKVAEIIVEIVDRFGEITMVQGQDYIGMLRSGIEAAKGGEDE